MTLVIAGVLLVVIVWADKIVALIRGLMGRACARNPVPP